MIEDIVFSVHGLLLNHLPVRHSKTPSGWCTFDCVMCADRRKRAGIIANGAKISYNCFNCGYKTGWSPSPHLGKKYRELAEKLGASKTEIHNVNVQLLKYSDQINDTEIEDYTFNFEKFNIIGLPENAVSIEDLPQNHEVVEYAKQRGIFGLYPLLYFDDDVYRSRVVVPFTYNGDLVGWTGRHINPPDKKTPKYFHNLPKGGYVFNIDRFIGSNRKTVIVTEGVFDAIQIDGVSVLGNTVSPEQAHLIEKLGIRVIVCPDRDDAGKKLINQAVALGWSVSFPPWEDDIKDAADAVARYGRLATVASIIKHATDNTIKIQVKTRML